jgi:hypothetical protein
MNLNSEFGGQCGFKKPGAKTSDILDTTIDKDISMDIVMVVCADSGDISNNNNNNAKEGLRNIISFVK